MEFLNGIIVQVAGHKLEYSQTLVFVWYSTLIFPFYKMLFMNRLEFSCFPDFLKDLKSRVEFSFLENPPVEGI